MQNQPDHPPGTEEEDLFEKNMKTNNLASCFRVLTKTYPDRIHSAPRPTRPPPQPTQLPPFTTAFCTTASTRQPGVEYARLGVAVFFEVNDIRNTAMLLPYELCRDHITAGVITIILAVRAAPPKIPLVLSLPNKNVRSLLIDRTPYLEDNNFPKLTAPECWRAAIAALRSRPAPTYLIHNPDSLPVEANKLAQQALSKASPDKLSLYIPPLLRLRGLKVTSLTQQTAYRAIRSLKQPVPRKGTNKNLEIIQKAVFEHTRNTPRRQDVWLSIRKPHIFRQPKQFLYSAIHDSFKLSKFFRHIPGAEDRVRCTQIIKAKYYEPGGALDSQTDSQSYVADYYNQAGDTMYAGIKEKNQAAKAVSHDNTLAKTCTVKIKREIEEEEENKLPMDLLDENTRTIIDLQTQLRRSQDDLYTVRLKIQTPMTTRVRVDVPVARFS
ncbi:hypothetical protein VNI00_013648 [Paramarasmius palmivorus]|uniref:Uncharacterized protein n=1 Tax=Paramarasmius palmivorus TaxID=297713 RepID=A0AAW0C0J2_9AGAR